MRKILISGASRGIGKAIALRLLKEGHYLSLGVREKSDLLNTPLDQKASSASLAKRGWQVLWPSELRRKQAIYKFGLEKLMRFEEKLLRGFFVEFFSLPNKQWQGFLTNKLSLKELISAMWKMFRKSPWTIKQGLMNMHGRELNLLLKAFIVNNK